MKSLTKTLADILAVAAAAFLFSSCIFEHTDPEDDTIKGTISIKVSVKSPYSTTKSTTITAEDEANVNMLQVLVFSTNGTLDTYGCVEKQDSLVLECLAGEKTIYAFVNGTDLSHIKYKSELLETPSYLSDNYTDSFVMWGTKDVKLSTDSQISIPVGRIASRIILSKITRDMTNTPSFKDADFSIENIYIINVPGEFYLGNASPTLWCNPSFNNYSCDDFLIDSVKESIQNKQSYDVTHTFYVYPNSTEKDSDSESWSARHSRLVVEVKIDGNLYYYPVTLPQIESNKTYVVSDILITRPGVTSPDLILTKSEVDADLEITDWKEALTTSASI